MKKRIRLLQKLTDSLDLPGEPLPGVSVAELCSDSRLLIDRHGGVLGYGPEQILIRVSYGLLQVEGTGLELAMMTAGQLMITGRVEKISVLRRDNE